MNITGIATAVALIASNIIPGTEGTPAGSWADNIMIQGNEIEYQGKGPSAVITIMAPVWIPQTPKNVPDAETRCTWDSKGQPNDRCASHGENCTNFTCR